MKWVRMRSPWPDAESPWMEHWSWAGCPSWPGFRWNSAMKEPGRNWRHWRRQRCFRRSRCFPIGRTARLESWTRHSAWRNFEFRPGSRPAGWSGGGRLWLPIRWMAPDSDSHPRALAAAATAATATVAAAAVPKECPAGKSCAEANCWPRLPEACTRIWCPDSPAASPPAIHPHSLHYFPFHIQFQQSIRSIHPQEPERVHPPPPLFPFYPRRRNESIRFNLKPTRRHLKTKTNARSKKERKKERKRERERKEAVTIRSMGSWRGPTAVMSSGVAASCRR